MERSIEKAKKQAKANINMDKENFDKTKVLKKNNNERKAK